MAELKPVPRGDRWRIRDYNPRFFGDFDSEAEAARWIKGLSWLAADTRVS